MNQTKILITPDYDIDNNFYLLFYDDGVFVYSISEEYLGWISNTRLQDFVLHEINNK